MVAPVFMPGAYTMIHLTHQSVDEPFTCTITDVAKKLSPTEVAWSYNMQQGSEAPNVKISAHFSVELQAFQEPAQTEAPLPRYVHGLVGTCSFDLYDGIQLRGAALPQQHICQSQKPSSANTRSSNSNSNNSGTMRAVFFPLAHPLVLKDNQVLDISIFRTVCGANDCYYFWDVAEDETALPLRVECDDRIGRKETDVPDIDFSVHDDDYLLSVPN